MKQSVDLQHTLLWVLFRFSATQKRDHVTCHGSDPFRIATGQHNDSSLTARRTPLLLYGSSRVWRQFLQRPGQHALYKRGQLEPRAAWLLNKRWRGNGATNGWPEHAAGMLGTQRPGSSTASASRARRIQARQSFKTSRYAHARLRAGRNGTPSCVPS
jgi:hypothetical protein